MNKYQSLINVSSPYASRMNRLSKRIFGDVVRNTNKTSMRVVKKLSEKPFYEEDYFVNYYPRILETNNLIKKLRFYGLYCDEHEDYKDELRRLRELKGKGKSKEERLKNRDLI